MSITKDGRSFYCDFCGDTFESEDFHDAITQIRAGYWKPIYNSGEWQHMCQDCQTAYEGY